MLARACVCVCARARVMCRLLQTKRTAAVLISVTG